MSFMNLRNILLWVMHFEVCFGSQLLSGDLEINCGVCSTLFDDPELEEN